MSSSVQRIFRKFEVLLMIFICLTACGKTSNAADLTIYAEALAGGWADWSWDTTRDFVNTSPVHGGAHSLAVTFNA